MTTKTKSAKKSGTKTPLKGGIDGTPALPTNDKKSKTAKAKPQEPAHEPKQEEPPARTQEQILADLRKVEVELSPENLTKDGEMGEVEVKKAKKRLKALRAGLVEELGREPTEEELFHRNGPRKARTEQEKAKALGNPIPEDIAPEEATNGQETATAEESQGNRNYAFIDKPVEGQVYLLGQLPVGTKFITVLTKIKGVVVGFEEKRGVVVGVNRSNVTVDIWTKDGKGKRDHWSDGTEVLLYKGKLKLELAPESKEESTSEKPSTPKEPKPRAESNGKKMSCIDAAAKVLEEAGTEMTCKQMIEKMEEAGYWTSPGGKTPDATLYSAIIRDIAKRGKESWFKKTRPSNFTSNQ